MSAEQLSAFLEAVRADISLQEKLNGVTDVNTVIAIAKEAGFLVTAEIIAKVQSQAMATALSDEELESVTGGTMMITIEFLRVERDIADAEERERAKALAPAVIKNTLAQGFNKWS